MTATCYGKKSMLVFSSPVSRLLGEIHQQHTSCKCHTLTVTYLHMQVYRHTHKHITRAMNPDKVQCNIQQLEANSDYRAVAVHDWAADKVQYQWQKILSCADLIQAFQRFGAGLATLDFQRCCILLSTWHALSQALRLIGSQRAKCNTLLTETFLHVTADKVRIGRVEGYGSGPSMRPTAQNHITNPLTTESALVQVTSGSAAAYALSNLSSRCCPWSWAENSGCSGNVRATSRDMMSST